MVPSLTLLALSNGAEMLTSYAAEKARTHISGLLSLDQRYVWLVEGETEKKVPVGQGWRYDCGPYRGKNRSRWPGAFG